MMECNKHTYRETEKESSDQLLCNNKISRKTLLNIAKRNVEAA